MPEFAPKFDYISKPKWKKAETGEWIPDIDEKTGLQIVDYKRVALDTFHQIPWPCDDSVSLIVQDSWLNLSKGWADDINPVSGHLWYIGQIGPNDFRPRYLSDEDFKLVQDQRVNKKPPVGTTLISVHINPHDHAVGYSIESSPR